MELRVCANARGHKTAKAWIVFFTCGATLESPSHQITRLIYCTILCRWWLLWTKIHSRTQVVHFSKRSVCAVKRRKHLSSHFTFVMIVTLHFRLCRETPVWGVVLRKLAGLLLHLPSGQNSKWHPNKTRHERQQKRVLQIMLKAKINASDNRIDQQLAAPLIPQTQWEEKGHQFQCLPL